MVDEKIIGFFIDTNVIIHYIILEKLKQRKDWIEEGNTKYNRYKKSYEFIKKIISLEDEIKDDEGKFYFNLFFGTI